MSESNEYSKEKIKQEVKKNSESSETRPSERQHSIDVYYVGAPGSEHLVANTVEGKQVGVQYFEGFDAVDVERKVIQQTERDALELIRKQPENFGEMAKNITKASSNEAKDIARLVKLLENSRDNLLTVDGESIDNPSVPKEALHLLVQKSEFEKMKPLLEEMGYTFREMENSRVEAEKGNSHLVFLYAKERD